MIKNDFMTLSRSLVKYVIEISGSWNLAIMNKVYEIMSSQWMAALLKYVNLALETVLHYMKINNINHLKDELSNVMVNFRLVWQSTCLALWWLLPPHSSFRYLQWIGCLGEMVGGQIFQSAVVGLGSWQLRT